MARAELKVDVDVTTVVRLAEALEWFAGRLSAVVGELRDELDAVAALRNPNVEEETRG